MSQAPRPAPRCAALVGPYLSGKTTLFESLLAAAGAVVRKGSVKDGTSVGDASPEARTHAMSVELVAASAAYLGDRWVFVDCPGSIEFTPEARAALMVADIAIVVADSEPAHALTLAPLLRFIDAHRIPHVVFVNKMDAPHARVRDVLAALQGVSERPLVLRQIPLVEGESPSGYVDLVSERAYRYAPNKPSDPIRLPDSAREPEQEARRRMLETLADFDDGLLERLLEDVVPPPNEIYKAFAKDLQDDLVAPVLLGSAINDHGVRRLLKLLRHETPTADITAARLGLASAPGAAPLARVFKTYHMAHTGKLSLARIWCGPIKEGAILSGHRAGGLYRMKGLEYAKLAQAESGDVVAFAKLDGVKTGDLLGDLPDGAEWPDPPAPIYGLALDAERREDEVKLSSALQRLIEEDPGLSVGHNHDTGDMILWGQGEIHLAVARERLGGRFNVPVKTRPPRVPYKETIRKAASKRGRYKRQSGGHGQYGDVHLDIKPLARGQGFEFVDRIVGGAVPRNYIPAVEEGVRETLRRGPHGFPVVDVSVALTDGSYHSVDSSDQAFKSAARLAITEGLAECDPVLLEPICHVVFSVPNEATARVQRLVSGRRGHILGYDSMPGWPGWDNVAAFIPQAEMQGMIVELRSLSHGVGSFAWRFDRLQELVGKLAEKVVANHETASS